MTPDPDGLPWRDLPAFLPRTERLLRMLLALTPAERQTLWQCNGRIAALNEERLSRMDLYHCLTPALLAFEGIQYRYMAPGVFTNSEFAYAQTHFRILSGFYGLLRPFDGVAPYRLEMRAKLRVGEAKDLYAFWGGRLAAQLAEETDCVLNLASREYSLCISKYLPPSVRFVTCVFGQLREGRVVERGTLCKMARGEMARYLAEGQIANLEQIRGFSRLGYHFDAERSDDSTCVFLLEPSGR